MFDPPAPYQGGGNHEEKKNTLHGGLGFVTGRWRWVSILLLAAGLRLWSVDFGLDIERVRPDEEFVVGKAQQMVSTSDLNPHFFHYPSLLIYVNAGLQLVAPSSVEPRLIGRLVSVACGVGTVLLVGLLGARLYSPTAGFLAALFLAVAYQHVRESHFATTDVPLVFLFTASFCAAAEGFRQRRLSLFRLSALLAGLAASIKYPGVLAVVPALFLGLSLPGLGSRERAREVLVGAFLFAAAFALTSPFVLLDAEGARQSFSELFREHWGDRRLASHDPWFPLTFSLRHGLGLPLLSLGVMGLLARSRNRIGFLLPLWFAIFYAAAAVTPTHFARYSLPAVPLLCLGAGLFVASLPVRMPIRAGLVVAAVLPSLLDSISLDRVLGREDTRALAASWIGRNLPEGTPILVTRGYGAPPIPSGYPVRQVGFRLGAVREGEREGFAHLVTHELSPLYRYSRIDESLAERLRSASLLARFAPFREGESPGLYDELDAFYVPYQRPGSVERPGPVVSIWRLDR
ncbi:MAG TPA: glycosyltransferase family 39 protein [Vicinamibacteria bacterium]